MAKQQIPGTHLCRSRGDTYTFAEVYSFDTEPGAVDFRMRCETTQIGFTIPADFARKIAAALVEHADAAEALAAASREPQEVAA